MKNKSIIFFLKAVTILGIIGLLATIGFYIGVILALIIVGAILLFLLKGMGRFIEWVDGFRL